ncbi:ribosome-binding factor A [Rossellomorea vietnamensis]|uniref:Ribosome-binding factor A n=1 Tax=Rossellomorea vietnamensis TaxID=218284 RepID=A0A5D4M9L5_9BACI|nr:MULTISPECIES: hypothetical protein [Bacillaceae]TYR98127.1 ribosome-binding factor A [Rossellomorea vietnamensis]
MNRYHPFYTPIQRPQTPNWPPVNPYYAMHRHPLQYPPVEPKQFMDSAGKMTPLLDDAKIIMNEVSQSKELAANLMQAAQKSNMGELNRLIKGTGVRNIPEIKFNPDGFTLSFRNKTGNVDCSHLTVILRWK